MQKDYFMNIHVQWDYFMNSAKISFAIGVCMNISSFSKDYFMNSTKMNRAIGVCMNA